MKSEVVCVGIIAKPVGIKGQVKIHPYTTSPASLLSYKELFLSDGSKICLLNPKVNEKGDIITFIEGVGDRNVAELIRLKNLFVAKNELPDLGENEYYLDDLSGLTVFGTRKQIIGKVLSALDYGAGAFLDIKLSENGKLATLPFNKTTVLNVNLNEKTLQIDESFLLR